MAPHAAAQDSRVDSTPLELPRPIQEDLDHLSAPISRANGAHPHDDNIRTEMFHRTARASISHMLRAQQQMRLMTTEVNDFMTQDGIRGHSRSRRLLNAAGRER